MNVPDDTKLAGFGLNTTTFQMAPLDANGNTSLRAVAEWANANPQIGNWNMNHIVANLGMISGATITLKANQQTPFVPYQTIALNSNFHVLAGAGNVTIERSTAAGTAAFNHFDVSAERECHFTGVTLRNGSSPVEGGSIFNNGTAYFQNCMFTENSTTDKGGAIATRLGATTIAFSCTFLYNSATLGGGAIAAVPESLVTSITDCTLMENETAGNGGAVWAKEAGSLSINNSSIVWNHATGEWSSFGGGVYVETTTTATISYTDISSNTAGWRGGGLYVLDCNLTMTGGELFNNTSAGHGGGFYFDATDKTITLNQVSITSNTATNGLGGGGFVNRGTVAGNLLAGQLTGNTAGGEGWNGSLPGIGVSVDAFWTITVAPGQQKVEVNTL